MLLTETRLCMSLQGIGTPETSNGKIVIIKSSSLVNIRQFLRTLGIGKPRSFDLHAAISLSTMTYYFTFAEPFNYLPKWYTENYLTCLSRPMIFIFWSYSGIWSFSLNWMLWSLKLLLFGWLSPSWTLF